MRCLFKDRQLFSKYEKCLCFDTRMRDECDRYHMYIHSTAVGWTFKERIDARKRIEHETFI